MKMKKNKWLSWLLILIVLPLHAAGCSDDNDNGLPNPESLTNETVIYEVNPNLFGTQNAFTSITNQLDEIKELGTNVLLAYAGL
ncbi:hypothetical protein NXY00_21740 [Bacteroides sp. BFG-551]|nr:hypothetical protein [Bacteroides sp. BFG-551]